MKKLVIMLTLAFALLSAAPASASFVLPSTTPSSAGFVGPMLPCDPGYGDEGC